jgi:hypothetical protein
MHLRPLGHLSKPTLDRHHSCAALLARTRRQRKSEVDSSAFVRSVGGRPATVRVPRALGDRTRGNLRAVVHDKKHAAQLTSFVSEMVRSIAAGMTSSDMLKLRSLYAEIERCLESGECCGAELERLYAEVYRIAPASEELWINFDPRGTSSLSAA